jgi:DNA-binding transcriptional LysR family regulator
VELVCTDRVVDLVDEGFDIAIRAGRLSDSTLVARKLGVLPALVVASPAYLGKRGTPKTPDDLSRHSCVAFGPRRDTAWTLVNGDDSAQVKIAARFAVNDFDLLREATIAGLGVALLPELGCVDEMREGRLKRLLPAWSSPETPIHAVYPSTRHLSSKVRAFVDHVQGKMAPGARTRPGAARQ